MQGLQLVQLTELLQHGGLRLISALHHLRSVIERLTMADVERRAGLADQSHLVKVVYVVLQTVHQVSGCHTILDFSKTRNDMCAPKRE